MRKEITKDKEFYIISRTIDNVEKCKVIEVMDDCFKVKLNRDRKYEQDEAVELFSLSESGHLYFETIVKEKHDDIISIWFPFSFKYLQRREYSRIEINQKIILNNNIECEIIDLSAGGLKISSNSLLELGKEYKINLNIDNHSIITAYQPIRIEISGDKYISSGKFNDMTSYDRITLVQYCFRKQISGNLTK